MNNSFRNASSWAAPHAAPAPGAPTSFSQPGGWQRALVSFGVIGISAAGGECFKNDGVPIFCYLERESAGSWKWRIAQLGAGAGADRVVMAS